MNKKRIIQKFKKYLKEAGKNENLRIISSKIISEYKVDEIISIFHFDIKFSIPIEMGNTGVFIDIFFLNKIEFMINKENKHGKINTMIIGDPMVSVNSINKYKDIFFDMYKVFHYYHDEIDKFFEITSYNEIILKTILEKHTELNTDSIDKAIKYNTLESSYFKIFQNSLYIVPHAYEPIIFSKKTKNITIKRPDEYFIGDYCIGNERNNSYSSYFSMFFDKNNIDTIIKNFAEELTLRSIDKLYYVNPGDSYGKMTICNHKLFEYFYNKKQLK